MKPIKIAVENTQAIEAALSAVNGRAVAHSYTTFSDVCLLAGCAEARLAALGLPKADRIGAEWHETSGSTVPNSYDRKGHSRRATAVTIVRKGAGWYLIDVRRADIGQQGGGPGRLTLTTDQDAECMRRLRASYSTK